MKYLVRVTETLVRNVIVEANSMEEAGDKVDQAYFYGQIVLDYDNLDDHEVQVIREATDEESKWFGVLEVE